jgi:hypothetical protein
MSARALHRYQVVFACEAAVRAERSEFISSLDGGRHQPMLFGQRKIWLCSLRIGSLTDFSVFVTRSLEKHKFQIG